MFDFIVEHQLNIILAMSGACGACALFVYISKTFSGYKKRDLILLELGATGLLLFDRGATIFDGEPGELAYWMVRACNLAVYILTLLVVFFFNMYLKDVVTENGDVALSTKMLEVTGILCLVGIGMVIIAHFTGLYYTFDANNTYQRAPAYFICYILPVCIPLMQIFYIFQYYKKIKKGVRLSLIFFPLFPMLASFLQFAFYGLMLTDMALTVACIQLYVIALFDTNSTLEENREKEKELLVGEEKTILGLFRQIVTAIVGALDEKDRNTRGHAARSAQYARKLAEMAGKDESVCEAAYFSALLHDIGKINLPDRILRKKGNLTEEEQKLLDDHVIRGRDILSGISEFPYLQEVAHYHHEWYDGSGIPDGLSGDEIPELARIMALADSYDEMSSIHNDMDPLPQPTVREEIVKGIGNKFDPTYARYMLLMIDNDKDYQLREHHEEESNELEQEMSCDSYRSHCSRGIPISEEITRITFRYDPLPEEMTEDENESERKNAVWFTSPSMILFDSFDGRIHKDERSIEINRYAEFGEVWFDGNVISTRARNMKINKNPDGPDPDVLPGRYMIEVARVRDHMRLRLFMEPDGAYESSSESVQTRVLADDRLCSEVIVALPDSSGTAFISLTGENCHLTEIEADTIGISLNEGDIPRIADEVTYIDRMVGDVPNIQVDGYLTDATQGMPVSDGMEIVFHTMTLPTATLVWHCPSLMFYKSDNNRINGPNYEELVIIRLDGESFERDEEGRSVTEMREDESFESWDRWKEINKKGYESKVFLRRKHNRIVMQTENAGINVKSTIYTRDGDEDVRVALTGEQCALTDIRFIYSAG